MIFFLETITVGKSKQGGRVQVLEFITAVRNNDRFHRVKIGGGQMELTRHFWNVSPSEGKSHLIHTWMERKKKKYLAPRCHLNLLWMEVLWTMNWVTRFFYGRGREGERKGGTGSYVVIL